MDNPYHALKILHHNERLNQLRNGIQPVPLHAQVVISDLCSHACEFCFPGDTKILTEYGYLPIFDIDPGIRVFDGDGNLQYVKDTFSRKYDGKLISLRFARLDVPFKVTPEHPVFIIGKGYVPASNVEVGDRVKVIFPKIPRIEEIRFSSILDNLIYEDQFVSYSRGKTRVPNIIKLTKEFGELCGYYLAEGHCSFLKNRPNSGDVTWTYNKDEKEYIRRTKELITKIFCLDGCLGMVGPSTQINVGSRILADFFTMLFGSGSREKQINPALWGASREFLDGLMLGYLRGDGCFDDHSFSTTSLSMCLGLLNIAYQNNLSPNLYSALQGTSVIDGRLIKGEGNAYTIRFRGEDRSVYSKLIGEKHRNMRVTNWKPHEKIIKDDLNKTFCGVSFEVKEKLEVDYSGMVYNLSVENSETYTASSISVHNCSYRDETYFTNKLFKVIDEKTGKVNNNPNRMIPYEKVQELIRDFTSMKIRACELTGGGEPTVHPQHTQIFQDIVDAEINLALVTHGALLTTQDIDILGKNAQWVRVSIDAGRPATYSAIRRVNEVQFHKACANIQKLAEVRDREKSDLVLGVGFVVTKENYKELDLAVSLAKSLGANNIRISAVFQSDDEKYFDGIYEEIAEECKVAKKRFDDDKFIVVNNFGERVDDLRQHSPDYKFCGYQNLVTYIGGDQNVYRCCTTSYNPQGLIGSIKEQSFKQLWYSQAKQNDFNNFDARSCPRCMFNSKNRMINYALETQPLHVNFI